MFLSDSSLMATLDKPFGLVLMHPFALSSGSSSWLPVDKPYLYFSSGSHLVKMVTFVSNYLALPNKSSQNRCVLQKCTQKPSHDRRSGPRAAASRAEVIAHGIEAALEDYLMTGMNIGIGDGSKEVLEPMLDSIASMVKIERLVDVAFLGTCKTSRSLLQERDLPNDLSVNFKREMDLFIAPVSRVDGDCNAVLDSLEFGGPRYAAHMAKKVVLLTHEDDLQKSRSGLESIPVQLVNFLPDVAAKSLFSDSLFAAGVRGVSLREGETNLADVSLAPNSVPLMVVEELARLPQVQAVGFLPAYDKTTVVVSTTDLQPFEITPIGYSLARSNESSTPLSFEKVKQEIRQLDGSWALSDTSTGTCGLTREFTCVSTEAAEALIRHVHFLTKNGGRFAELKQVQNKVFIGLGEYGSTSLYDVDLLMAKALTKTYAAVKKPVN
ncbi:hypothetical protein FGB62_59g036 [Gracilaria domingensis]|nr:hypothetical protein FGB62_59g036 [Gracilaria domingensis]